MARLYSKIAVPYDHSKLSQQALEFALNLASEDTKIELNVITVIRPEVTLSYRIPKDGDTKYKAAEEIRKEVERQLAELPNKTETVVLKGNPAQRLIDYAEDNEVDLIVMGSRGLGGVKEKFLGSVSHHVVQRARCPVLIVK